MLHIMILIKNTVFRMLSINKNTFIYRYLLYFLKRSLRKLLNTLGYTLKKKQKICHKISTLD